MSTIRQKISGLLSEEELGAKDLSRLLSIGEKEVYTHLEHIARSVSTGGSKLVVTPCRCLSCAFVFSDRQRFTRPGRCPKCRGNRISPPAYRIK